MKIALALLAPLTLLTACSAEPDAPPAADNAAEMLDVTDEAANVAEAPPPEDMANLMPPANLSDDAPEPVGPDEQVLEDADATGMTSRVDRDAAPNPDERPRPAEETIGTDDR